MKKTLVTLLLLSLTLTACIVEPGGGYRGGRDHERGEFHSDRDSRGDWRR